MQWPWLHLCSRNMMPRDLNWIQRDLFISLGDVLEAELDKQHFCMLKRCTSAE